MLADFCAPNQGYPSKRAAIVHLHSRGLGVDVIAAAVGSTRDAVKTVLSTRGLKPNRQSVDGAGQAPQLLEMPTDIVIALRSHAARRDLTCTALAAAILEAVLRDGIVDAVLDDREG